MLKQIKESWLNNLDSELNEIHLYVISNSCSDDMSMYNNIKTIE
jgi:hypothetical protein